MKPLLHAMVVPFMVPTMVPLLLSAQQPAADASVAGAVAAWTVIDASASAESYGTRALAKALPGWTSDGWGNLVRHVGSGSPRRVVACALDHSGYVVSQVTSDGYLRLRRIGARPPHPLWDQFHEAQQVKVLTARGVVHGVAAVANGHFAAQHRGDTTVVSVDDIWIDVGAASAADVQQLGVSLIDAVIADRPAWTFEGYAAGPAAGMRAGCAAVATAAAGRVQHGETVFVLSMQQALGWVGLGAVLTHLGAYDALTIVDEGQASAEDRTVPAARAGRGFSSASRTFRTDSVHLIAPRVRWAGSLVETIHADDARALLKSVASAADVALAGDGWVAPALDTARVLASRARYADIERQWMALADIPGVSGHEAPVREAVLAALPAWARRVAVVDSMGNIIVAMGPDRDSVAFIAHTDEVGFEVTAIHGDGRVSLRTRGGAVITSWEGVPALLHFDAGADGRVVPPLRGVFVPRDSARVKSPGTLTAWFGLDSAQMVAHGVHPGLSLTAYKRAQRLFGTRLTGRASDDRTGATTLLFAIRRLHPDSLAHKVIFVWSVQEEGGLNGARYFGERTGPSLRRVYSIDTFVSSDTPKESPHFAFAPLGAGPVLRSLDNASLVPRAERERIEGIARANGIPLQLGTTFGSTDGSSIQQWGPPNIGLSWPGRYSHGPAEVLDLRDVDALIRLVAAVAVKP